MTKTLLPILLVAFFEVLKGGCTGSVSPDCTPNAETRCAEGATYWLDSCGKQGDKVADCGCGCNSDFASCNEPCDCTPNCGGRTCGLDPICGTLSCGTCSAATAVCNTATGTCETAPECPAITGSRDAIIKQRDPDLNFGHVDYVEVGVLSNTAYRSLSQFDIETPAGTKVQSASFDLFWDYSRPTRPTATEVEIYRADKPWQENSVSWNKRDLNDTWENPGCDWRDKDNVAQGTTPYASISLPVGNAANDYLSLDITQLVQEWSDGTYPNYGLLLKTSNAGETIDENHIAFVGLEDATGNNLPRLMITTATCASEQVATPVFKPPSGTYSAAQDVAVSTNTADASIRYTLDGSQPTESASLYSAPIKVSSTTAIKAKAFKSGLTPSAVATATYTMDTAGALNFKHRVSGIYWDKAMQNGEMDYAVGIGADAYDMYFVPSEISAIRNGEWDYLAQGINYAHSKGMRYHVRFAEFSYAPDSRWSTFVDTVSCQNQFLIDFEWILQRYPSLDGIEIEESEDTSTDPGKIRAFKNDFLLKEKTIVLKYHPDLDNGNFIWGFNMGNSWLSSQYTLGYDLDFIKTNKLVNFVAVQIQQYTLQQSIDRYDEVRDKFADSGINIIAYSYVYNVHAVWTANNCDAERTAICFNPEFFDEIKYTLSQGGTPAIFTLGRLKAPIGYWPAYSSQGTTAGEVLKKIWNSTPIPTPIER